MRFSIGVPSWVQRWVQDAGIPRNPAQSYQGVSAILAPDPRFPYSPLPILTVRAEGRSVPPQSPAPITPRPHLYAPMNWSSDAETSLREIPFVVRPIIRRRIESLAREAGLDGVDLAFYEQAKERFGRR